MDLTPEKEDLIRRYIEVGLQRGYSKEQVKQKFMGHGYNAELFDEVYNHYFAKKGKVSGVQPFPSQRSERETPPPRRVVEIPWKKIGISLGVVLIIAALFIGGFLLWQSSTTEKTCSTRECFFEAANQCQAAALRNTVEGTEFRLTTTKECRFHKKITSFGPEPQEVQRLLGEKELTCTYTQGNFKPVWVDSLTIGLESCSGELKDALMELLTSTTLSIS